MPILRETARSLEQANKRTKHRRVPKRNHWAVISCRREQAMSHWFKDCRGVGGDETLRNRPAQTGSKQRGSRSVQKGSCFLTGCKLSVVRGRLPLVRTGDGYFAVSGVVAEAASFGDARKQAASPRTAYIPSDPTARHHVCPGSAAIKIRGTFASAVSASSERPSWWREHGRVSEWG